MHLNFNKALSFQSPVLGMLSGALYYRAYQTYGQKETWVQKKWTQFFGKASSERVKRVRESVETALTLGAASALAALSYRNYLQPSQTLFSEKNVELQDSNSVKWGPLLAPLVKAYAAFSNLYNQGVDLAVEYGIPGASFLRANLHFEHVMGLGLLGAYNYGARGTQSMARTQPLLLKDREIKGLQNSFSVLPKFLLGLVPTVFRAAPSHQSSALVPAGVTSHGGAFVWSAPNLGGNFAPGHARNRKVLWSVGTASTSSGSFLALEDCPSGTPTPGAPRTSRTLSRISSQDALALRGTNLGALFDLFSQPGTEVVVRPSLQPPVLHSEQERFLTGLVTPESQINWEGLKEFAKRYLEFIRGSLCIISPQTPAQPISVSHYLEWHGVPSDLKTKVLDFLNTAKLEAIAFESMQAVWDVVDANADEAAPAAAQQESESPLKGERFIIPRVYRERDGTRTVHYGDTPPRRFRSARAPLVQESFPPLALEEQKELNPHAFQELLNRVVYISGERLVLLNPEGGTIESSFSEQGFVVDGHEESDPLRKALIARAQCVQKGNHPSLSEAQKAFVLKRKSSSKNKERDSYEHSVIGSPVRGDL